MIKCHEGGVMKYTSFILLAGLLLIAGFMACDWNNHTEPKINVDNSQVLGMAIYLNQSPVYPMGLNALFVNEGDTLDLMMSTDLLKEPEYVFTFQDEDVMQILPAGDDPAHYYVIAQADSGRATFLTVNDVGNHAVKELYVQVVKHWADPANFTFINSLGGHYYYLSNNLKGWVEAKQTCEEAGGYMAVINSAEENQLLDDGRGMIENAWIGIRFNRIGEGEDDWELKYWVNGDTLDYENFVSKPSEPGIFAEYYFHMDVNGRWENWHEISYNYFLEME
jgi:hypothetical protein